MMWFYMTYGVFSAHAEVVPRTLAVPGWLCCILRARGGSSLIITDTNISGGYSPRTRR